MAERVETIQQEQQREGHAPGINVRTTERPHSAERELLGLRDEDVLAHLQLVPFNAGVCGHDGLGGHHHFFRAVARHDLVEAVTLLVPFFELTVKAPDIAAIRFSGPRNGEFLAADEIRFTTADAK